MDGILRGGSSLLPGLAFSGLSVHDMWLAYVAVGGNKDEGDLVWYMAGGSTWNVREHDMAALALNEECYSTASGSDTQPPMAMSWAESRCPEAGGSWRGCPAGAWLTAGVVQDGEFGGVVAGSLGELQACRAARSRAHRWGCIGPGYGPGSPLAKALRLPLRHAWLENS